MMRLLFLLVGLTAWSAQTVQALESRAQYALLMDASSGIVLYEKNADSLMSPASMSKLMTVLMVFEAIEENRITLDEEFRVSDDAWRRGGTSSGGSTMFLKARSMVSVEDLLRGVIIQSGNDASIALAEGLGGGEETFAEMMTDRALDLGMMNSTFRNSTGWPDPEHKTTARDLALLARHLILQFPEYYGMFAERDFTWNGITQSNRNPLLYAGIGADGLKTGHTEDSGYGLVASAEQNGRRLILVINGLETKRERAREANRLMNWGFRSFSTDILADTDDIVLRAPVWQGEFSTVGLSPQRDFKVLLPHRGKRKMVVTATYEKPLMTPIEKGTVVGSLRMTAPGIETQEVPLVTASDVAREGTFARALSALAFLIFGE
ncbi:MAG: D-alanyl-D-alanine carboxypeptidase family protein [Parvibaculales bacterium]